ncbi:hypothetical protein BCR39DRAFT_525132 [Naematelia encephala]|uniref:Zn(2)-C6 fungal-type domain-containing protein n=1 Tax=Naematelia encephala TaxID=71784 RepID=A0A1Y2BBV0_9TREE|nr:hypothetical protein BCR39DRAFT_525132 [Naematelia encephala]
MLHPPITGQDQDDPLMTLERIAPKDPTSPISLPFVKELRDQIQAYLEPKGAHSIFYASAQLPPLAMDHAADLPDRSMPLATFSRVGGVADILSSSTNSEVHNGTNNITTSNIVPFTNQLAYQGMFTPEGWSFENPFEPQQPEASGSRTFSVQQGVERAGEREEKRSSQSIYDTFVNPPIHLATGDRFLQLLEQKMNLQQQPQSSQPALDNDLLNLPLQSSMSMNNPLNQQQYDSLAVEMALHDLTQVEIPPDLVAPLPPNMFSGWGNWGAGSEVLQTGIVPQGSTMENTQVPWSIGVSGAIPAVLPSAPMSSVQPAYNSTTQSLTDLPHNPSSSWASIPPPLPRIPHASSSHSAPLSLPSFLPPAPVSSASTTSLPPVLKIRVLDTQSPTASPSPGPSHKTRVAALGSRPNGNWAHEMLSSQSSSSSPDLWGRPTASPITRPQRSSQKPPKSTSANSRQILNLPAPIASGSKCSASPEASAGDRPFPFKSQAEDVKKETQPTAASSDGDGEEKKIIIACHMCRSRKLKCDGERPKCHHCSRRKEDECVYDAVLRRRGPGKKSKKEKERERHQQEYESQDTGMSLLGSGDVEKSGYLERIGGGDGLGERYGGILAPVTQSGGSILDDGSRRCCQQQNKQQEEQEGRGKTGFSNRFEMSTARD